VAPLASAAGVNVLKEWSDTHQPGGVWGWEDVAVGTLGGCFGIGLAHLWEASPPEFPNGSPILAGMLAFLIPGGGHFYRGTPHAGWTYLGLEAGMAFPLLVTSPQTRPATYGAALTLFGALKIMEILDAVSFENQQAVPRLAWHQAEDGFEVSLQFVF